MAYLALYRKYRPTGFDGLIGQDHVVTTLVNQMLVQGGMFRANEQAIRLLTAAQQKAEAQVMEEDRVPLYLHGQPAHNAKGSPFGGAGSANGAD